MQAYLYNSHIYCESLDSFSPCLSQLKHPTCFHKNGYSNLKQLYSLRSLFPDHYRYKSNDFEKIIDKAKNENLQILTTEKDYMKIPEKFKKEIKFLSIDLIIQNENQLIELLKS